MHSDIFSVSLIFLHSTYFFLRYYLPVVICLPPWAYKLLKGGDLTGALQNLWHLDVQGVWQATTVNGFTEQESR